MNQFILTLNVRITNAFFLILTDPIEIKISQENQIKLMETGLTPKQTQIQNMPFDILYLTAAYYIRSLDRMKEENEKFKEVKNQLLDQFDAIDIILKEIWKNKKSHSYNKNDITEINMLAKIYIDYLNLNNKSNECEEIFNNLNNIIP